MKDLSKMQTRYMRDEWPVRLGNLASNLLRLSKWIQTQHDDKATIDLIRQSAWFIEWTAQDTPIDTLVELIDVQRELCLWQRIWPAETARPLLVFRARVMSQRVLELSGLLK